MPSKKQARAIIREEEVPDVFDAARIEELAKIAKLPATTDLARLGEKIREAARIFVRDARIPNVNQLNDEIAALCKVVDPYPNPLDARPMDWEGMAVALEKLSPEARKMLGRRGARRRVPFELPPPGALRDPTQRDDARWVIVTLVSQGAILVEGRSRGAGKRSGPISRPLLYAPPKKPNPPRRVAERAFVMWLSLAYCEVTDAPPSRTARHSDEGRELGPFARLAHECLRLVGAAGADVVELINYLHRHRQRME
jgi:hypothetical protein